MFRCELVRNGHGWAILPGVGIGDDVACAALSAAPLHESEIQRQVSLAISRPRLHSAAAEFVAQELTGQVRSAVEDCRWPSAQLAGSLVSGQSWTTLQPAISPTPQHV